MPEPEAPKTISILTVQPEGVDSRSMLPTPAAMLAKTTEVSIEALTANLTRTLGALGKVVDQLPEPSGQYELDSLTFTLALNAAGRVSLVAELSGGHSSSVTITLKRHKP